MYKVQLSQPYSRNDSTEATDWRTAWRWFESVWENQILCDSCCSHYKKLSSFSLTWQRFRFWLAVRTQSKTWQVHFFLLLFGACKHLRCARLLPSVHLWRHCGCVYTTDKADSVLNQIFRADCPNKQCSSVGIGLQHSPIFQVARLKLSGYTFC